MRWFFTLCRLYFERTLPAPVAEARVKCLSVRVAAALQEVGAPPVHRIFEKKHGSITGAQYRCASLALLLVLLNILCIVLEHISLCVLYFLAIGSLIATSTCDASALLTLQSYRLAVGVLEVVLADQPATLRRGAHILVQWYNATRCLDAGAPAVTTLRQAGEQLRDTWHAAFHAPNVHNLSRIPKLHRVEHVPRSVYLFGPYIFLTTEASECAHKQLKAMFRTYVPNDLRVLCLRSPFSCVYCVAPQGGRGFLSAARRRNL